MLGDCINRVVVEGFCIEEVMEHVRNAYDGLGLEYEFPDHNILCCENRYDGIDMMQCCIIHEDAVVFKTVAMNARCDPSSDMLLGMNCRMHIGGFERSGGTVRYRSDITMETNLPHTNVVEKHIHIGFEAIRCMQDDMQRYR